MDCSFTDDIRLMRFQAAFIAERVGSKLPTLRKLRALQNPRFKHGSKHRIAKHIAKKWANDEVLQSS